MNKRNEAAYSRDRLRNLTGTSLLVAIMVALNLLGLGKVSIPPIGITLLQIPVVAGTLIFGLYSGLTLGLTFGLLSLYNAYTAPLPLSIPFQNPFFAIVPRMAIALVVFLVAKAMSYDAITSKTYKTAILGAVGSVTNTVLVLGGQGLFYAETVSDAMGISSSIVWKTLGGVAIVNGVPELIGCAILTGVVVGVWRKIDKQKVSK